MLAMLKINADVSPITLRGGKMGIPNISQPPQKCFFMDLLPLELRLTVYEYLVVSPTPLRGKTARKEDERTGLGLTVLRVNRQIYAEALPLFYGKNTFSITSIPETRPLEASPSEDEDSQNGITPSKPRYEFDPPLPPAHWPLVRHLTVSLLYLPKTLVSELGHNGIGWKPIDDGAMAYISLIINLLTACGLQLQSLNLCVDVLPTFCVKKCLVGFFMCDVDHAFACALAALSIIGRIKSMPLSFEFQDCYFRTAVDPVVFLRKSILSLACQVMLCQSQLRVKALVEDFEKRGAVKKGGAEGEVKTDLRPFVGPSWGGKGVPVVETV
ncbi:hypothetical protein K505DRAFT_321534 [Melanomma pulvis-pyrius CBS 109.77]|uniref:Uncharacterized protein n=1 Tax=Melanomma pulvis-pyrius CBS 109.77 TaxID=1314802 RepID=A0A6A6XRR8_9PLEO|nr:hypothetical protein K505DRAFT_321534 [Melanomma pulvis-pyrius CBS 109.77]